MVLVSTGALRNRYLHRPAVDEILADENVYGGVLWPLRDQFYSVRDLVDHTGNHYNHIDYNAFGELIRETNGPPYAIVHAYGFQSREWDRETDLNFHRGRYYNRTIGHWMSEDPIGFAGGDVNLNRFVGNSPTNRRDGYGLFEELLQVRTFQARDFVPYSDFGPLDLIPDFSPFLDRSAEWEVLAERERRRERAEELRRIAEAPSMSEPPSIDLAIEGVGLLFGGSLGKVDDVADAGRLVLNHGDDAVDGVRILNPDFTPDGTRVLQNLTNRVNGDLASNPSLGTTVLSRAEIDAATIPALGPVQYGNALERLVANEIRNDPVLGGLFHHNLGPGPDFIGLGPFGGQIFDITTQGQIPRHLGRPYGQGLNIVVYPGYPWR